MSENTTKKSYNTEASDNTESSSYYEKLQIFQEILTFPIYSSKIKAQREENLLFH